MEVALTNCLADVCGLEELAKLKSLSRHWHESTNLVSAYVEHRDLAHSLQCEENWVNLTEAQQHERLNLLMPNSRDRIMKWYWVKQPVNKARVRRVVDASDYDLESRETRVLDHANMLATLIHLPSTNELCVWVDSRNGDAYEYFVRDRWFLDRTTLQVTHCDAYERMMTNEYFIDVATRDEIRESEEGVLVYSVPIEEPTHTNVGMSRVERWRMYRDDASMNWISTFVPAQTTTVVDTSPWPQKLLVQLSPSSSQRIANQERTRLDNRRVYLANVQWCVDLISQVDFADMSGAELADAINASSRSGVVK